MPTGGGWIPGAGECLAAAVACVLAAFLFTAPWVPNETSVVTTYQGESEAFARLDASIWTYLLSWGAHHPGRFYEPPILLPLRASGTANDPRLTENLWFAPLFRALPPVTAWGWSTIAALALTAFTAYLAGRRISGSRWGGAAVAVLFAFGLFRANHVCHVENLFAPLLPLVPAVFLSFLETPTRRGGAIFGAVLGLAIVEYSYSAVALCLTLLPALAWGSWRRALPRGGLIRFLVVVTAIVGAILLPVAIQFSAFHTETSLARSLAEIDYGSANVLAWVTGPDGRVLPPLGGEGNHFFDVRLFPGFITLLLAGVGWLALWRRSPELAVAGILSVVLSFGTFRTLAWELGLPHVAFPTPYEILLEILLPLRAIRSPARLAVVGHLVLAIAAALAVAGLARKGRSWRGLLALLLALSFAESRMGMHATVIFPERARAEAWEWVGAQPGSYAVLEVPMRQILTFDGNLSEAETLFSSMRHGRPTPNGVMAIYLPWHESIAAHLARPQRPEVMALTRALGIRFIVARDDAAARPWIERGLRVVYADTLGLRVLEVEGAASPPRTPAELQERLFDLSHAKLLEDEADRKGAIIAPSRLAARAARKFEVAVEVRNMGTETWCVSGAAFGLGPAGDVIVQTRAWTEAEGPRVGQEVRGVRGQPMRVASMLPYDVAPGETAVAVVKGVAPPRPGRYRIDLDLQVRRGPWFHAADSPAATMLIEVSP